MALVSCSSLQFWDSPQVDYMKFLNEKSCSSLQYWDNPQCLLSGCICGNVVVPFNIGIIYSIVQIVPNVPLVVVPFNIGIIYSTLNIYPGIRNVVVPFNIGIIHSVYYQDVFVAMLQFPSTLG